MDNELPQKIDFVIYWVDGADPAHVEKRKHYLKSFSLQDASNKEQSFDDLRFIQHDELRFCLRSIVNYAPWYNKIFVVTDNQFPGFLNTSLVSQERIEFVSHQELFHGCQEYLPTFNSRAITSRLHRLERLSEYYLVGNDDVMLGGRVDKSFFFNGLRPVIYGDWISKQQRPAGLNQQGILNGAAMMGYSADRFIMPSHGFLPFCKSDMYHLESQFSYQFQRNISYRFRHEEQFLVESLYNHFCIAKNKGVMEDTVQMVHFSCELCRIGSEEKINFLFELIRSGQRKMFCINEIQSLIARMPEILLRLSTICGPALSCELG